MRTHVFLGVLLGLCTTRALSASVFGIHLGGSSNKDQTNEASNPLYTRAYPEYDQGASAQPTARSVEARDASNYAGRESSDWPFYFGNHPSERDTHLAARDVHDEEELGPRMDKRDPSIYAPKKHYYEAHVNAPYVDSSHPYVQTTYHDAVDSYNPNNIQENYINPPQYHEQEVEDSEDESHPHKYTPLLKPEAPVVEHYPAMYHGAQGSEDKYERYRKSYNDDEAANPPEFYYHPTVQSSKGHKKPSPEYFEKEKEYSTKEREVKYRDEEEQEYSVNKDHKPQYKSYEDEEYSAKERESKYREEEEYSSRKQKPKYKQCDEREEDCDQYYTKSKQTSKPTKYYKQQQCDERDEDCDQYYSKPTQTSRPTKYKQQQCDERYEDCDQYYTKPTETSKTKYYKQQCDERDEDCEQYYTKTKSTSKPKYTQTCDERDEDCNYYSKPKQTSKPKHKSYNDEEYSSKEYKSKQYKQQSCDEDDEECEQYYKSSPAKKPSYDEYDNEYKTQKHYKPTPTTKSHYYGYRPSSTSSYYKPAPTQYYESKPQYYETKSQQYYKPTPTYKSSYTPKPTQTKGGHPWAPAHYERPYHVPLQNEKHPFHFSCLDAPILSDPERFWKRFLENEHKRVCLAPGKRSTWVSGVDRLVIRYPAKYADEYDRCWKYGVIAEIFRGIYNRGAKLCGKRDGVRARQEDGIEWYLFRVVEKKEKECKRGERCD